MLRGAGAAAGRARNPARERDNGRLVQRVGGGRQAWPHAIVASPLTDGYVAMPAREDARLATCPTRHYAPAATHAPARKNVAIREQGEVRHPDGQTYPTTTAAVDGGFGARSREEAALAAQLQDVRRKARNEYNFSRKRMGEMNEKVVACRQRAEDAENKLQLVTDELAQEQMASDALAAIVREKTDLLAEEEERTKGLKKLTETLLRERAGSNEWADELARGTEALTLLYPDPDGEAVGPPRQAEMKARCSPGLLRDIFLGRMARDCACRREFAANGLTNPEQRFQDIAVLGTGGFGTVHRGRCNKTRRYYAIKTVKPGKSPATLLREMLAYAIMPTHANIVSIDCLSDVVGSEGLVMEIAVCDLYKAATGTSGTAFTLAEQISFEADATVGLNYMHDLGLVHCDHKVENTLICRGDSPTGFVGKVTDPGLWCGVGELRAPFTGTGGWIPLESAKNTVPAAANQDTFAVAVDLCFILAHPVMKTEVVSMWAHTKLMTDQERERLHVLKAEGGSTLPLLAEVTERTMSDGSLAQIFLRPGNLNSALPPSELWNTCEVLKKTVSRNPMDRLNMTAITAFLRDLACKTAAREQTLATIPPGIGVRPGIALLPGLSPLPNVAPPSGFAPPPGLAPPPGITPPPGIDLPPPAMSVVVGGGDGGGDVVPLADGTREAGGLIVHASGLPAAGLVGDSGGRDGNGLGGLAQEGRSSQLPLEGQPEAERMPSMGWIYPASPLLVEPHAGGADVGAGAAVPSVEVAEAPRASELMGSAPHAEGRHDGAVIPSVQEIAGWVDHLPPQLPGSASQALGNRLADTLRTLGGSFLLENVPPPVASVPLAGQAYPVHGDGGGGGSGGSGGGGDGSDGGEELGGGHAQEEEREMGVEVAGRPDTQFTFAQVLTRGFGTSAPTDDAATPPAAPRPRVVGGPDAALTFAQVLARGFGTPVEAIDAATSPAAPHAGRFGPV